MRDIRVAAVSMASRPGEPAANLAKHAAFAQRAAEAGADLVLFPEMSVSGYWTDPGLWHVAEPVPGPSTEALQGIAGHANLVVAAGIAEKDRDIVYNSVVLVGPQGYIGKSRKLHIPVPEYGSWRGGVASPVHETPLGRLAVNVCFDNWFPESARLVALQGAEVLLSPWVWSYGTWRTAEQRTGMNRAWKEHVGRVLPARAYENGLYVVAVNESGPVDEKGFVYCGHPVCLVYDPHGQLIAESEDEAGGDVMVIADLTSAALEARRSETHYHPKFRRPELYGPLAAEN